MNITEEERIKAEEITAILGEMAMASGCMAAIVRKPSELRSKIMTENSKAFSMFAEAAMMLQAAGQELGKGLPGIIFKQPLNFN